MLAQILEAFLFKYPTFLQLCWQIWISIIDKGSPLKMKLLLLPAVDTEMHLQDNHTSY